MDDELIAKIKAQDVDFRTFKGSELRIAAGERTSIEGYAAVFNQYSQDLGGFVEIIDPGFFDDCMEDDVRALLNHDPNFILGRTTSGTLEIKQDTIGLWQRTYPPVVEPDVTQWAKDFMVTLKRGEINQQSFAFQVKRTWRGDPEDGDEWFMAGEIIVRRLKKGGCRKLVDVSPVTYPAYLQTNVSASTRSLFEEFKKSIPAGQVPQVDDNAGERQVPLDVLQRRLDLASND
jgi:uncharacterized protein